MKKILFTALVVIVVLSTISPIKATETEEPTTEPSTEEVVDNVEEEQPPIEEIEPPIEEEQPIEPTEEVDKSDLALWVEEKINVIIAALASLGLSVGTLLSVLKWLKGRTKNLTELSDKYGLSNKKLFELVDLYSTNLEAFENSAKNLTTDLGGAIKSISTLKEEMEEKLSKLEKENEMLYNVLKIVFTNDRECVSSGISEKLIRMFEEYEKSNNKSQN